MAVDIVVRSGDDQPTIRRILSENLTGYTGKFFMWNPEDGSPQGAGIDVVISDAETGQVDLALDPTPPPGFYFGKYVFTNTGDNKIMTIPNSIPLSVMVTSDLTSEYSYSGDPSLRPVDRIRFLLQDTDTFKAMLSDSEILFLIEEYSSPYLAAAEAAMIISSKYASFRDKTVGPLSIRYGGMQDRYVSLAASLRARARNNSGALATTTQTSRPPIFNIGMHDIDQGSDLLGNL